MPKKFKGENSKASVARARKEAVRLEEVDRKQKELDDEYWRDDEKHLVKKQQRKDDKEKKRQEQLDKKKEQQQLYEEELAQIKSAKPAPTGKLTRHDIELQKEKQITQRLAARQDAEVDDQQPLEENINQLLADDGARTVEDAISVLSVGEPGLDKHPEKRMKAAFTAYESTNMPLLKAEHPNLRLSQLKQLLKKEWMKSPENPMNQRHMAYNVKK